MLGNEVCRALLGACRTLGNVLTLPSLRALPDRRPHVRPLRPLARRPLLTPPLNPCSMTHVGQATSSEVRRFVRRAALAFAPDP